MHARMWNANKLFDSEYPFPAGACGAYQTSPSNATPTDLWPKTYMCKPDLAHGATMPGCKSAKYKNAKVQKYQSTKVQQSGVIELLKAARQPVRNPLLRFSLWIMRGALRRTEMVAAAALHCTALHCAALHCPPPEEG
jgi:hypothetical protein